MKKSREEQRKKNQELGWKYFTVTEVDKTKNGYTDEQLKNMDVLVKKVLDPLRAVYGKPIHVNSGIRDFVPEGGSNTSHHMKGMAVDIEGYDYSNEENKKLASLLLKMKLPYTQIINEFGWSWLHIAYNPQDSRKRLTLSYGKREKPSYLDVDKNKFLV